MPDVMIKDDPPPVPPVPPDDNACCGSGCDPCIFDFYTEELQRYRAELQAWEERQRDKAPGGSQ